jgi:hypothetical protein
MATGRTSKAICDKCGDKIPYTSLVRDKYNRGLRVCPRCVDEKEPKEPRISENIYLKHPRPDAGDPSSTVQPLADALGFDNYFGGGT